MMIKLNIRLKSRWITVTPPILTVHHRRGGLCHIHVDPSGGRRLELGRVVITSVVEPIGGGSKGGHRQGSRQAVKGQSYSMRFTGFGERSGGVITTTKILTEVGKNN